MPRPPHITRCGRCKHRFDSTAESYAGISLVPADGWNGLRFRQLHLCATCAESLKAWLGIAPEVINPASLPPRYRA